MPKNEIAAAPAGAAYTKEQLMRSKRYAARRDLLNALLEDGGTYTLAETDTIISQFMKGAVK